MRDITEEKETKQTQEDNQSEGKEVKMGKASYLLNQHYDYKNQDLYKEFLTGDKPSLRNLFKKKLRREDKLKIARQFVWECGLLYRIIKLKVDYIIDGFEIYHENEDVLKRYQDLNEQIDIKQYITNAAFEHEVSGEWFPYLSWNGGDLKALTILDPAQIKVENIFGENLIYLKPSDQIRNLINSPDKRVQKRVRQAVPREYYDKWSKGQEVLLKEDEVFRFSNMKPAYDNYSHSPVEPIFDDLALLSMYKESDYSVAYKISKAILQIKVGDQEVFQGEPVPEEVLEQAEEMFRGHSESSEIITQWFMDAEWIIPDVDVYATEKYEPVINSILKWSGVEIFLGDGGAYSDANIKARGFYKDVKAAREEIKKSVLKIYKTIAEKKDWKTYGKENYKYPEVKFSQKSLKSNDELLESLKFLYKNGMLTPETTMDNLGFNYDKEKNIKEQDGKMDEYLEYITVPYEPSQDINMKSLIKKAQERELEREKLNLDKEEDEE